MSRKWSYQDIYCKLFYNILKLAKKTEFSQISRKNLKKEIAKVSHKFFKQSSG